MKRAAIYYESKDRVGRNDGAPLYYWNILKKMDFEVHHIIPDPNLPSYKEYGEFDYHFWVDWGEDALGLPYELVIPPSPNVYIASDTHLGFDHRLQMAKKFDYVFCNQIRAVEEFDKAGVKAMFHPHAVEPQAYPNTDVINRYDICFVGHVGNDKRIDFLDRMFKEFPNFWFGQRLFEKAAHKFCESKIVLNTAAVDDINMRCFEATATGSFLLTEWVPTLSECFEDGKHLVTYKDMDEAVEKAKYYLEHEDEREAIAKAGMEHTLANHTYLHRAKKILEVINGNT